MLPSGSVQARYERLVAASLCKPDPAQKDIISHLDVLREKLLEYRLARKSNVLGWFFARRGKPQAPSGLYLWGGVGRGKTMLMDLFFESIDIRRKKRVHFHAFMADVHQRIHLWREERKTGSVKGDDPIAPLAKTLSEEAWLLCFDEFAVTDITDAMILARLFTALFENGVVVVATSNLPPHDLYKDGLNRALFVPFIAKLEDNCTVLELQSRTDYRLEKLRRAPLFYHPADDTAKKALDDLFFQLSGSSIGDAITLDVQGHPLVLPQVKSGIVRMSFQELCGQAYAAQDYLHLARRFHTLILEDIPQMDEAKRNEAKRFIWLIDELYEHHVTFIASMAVPFHDLYKAESGYEAFAFERTLSRLTEMSSLDYLAKVHSAGYSTLKGISTGLVET